MENDRNTAASTANVPTTSTPLANPRRIRAGRRTLATPGAEQDG